MMLFPILFTAFCIIHSTYSADHNTYKNCSRVEFCSSLRDRAPSDVYNLDITTLDVSIPHILTAKLTANNGDPDLIFTLFGLYPATFRVKITEVDSSRYELKDVLDGDLQNLEFDNVTVGVEDILVRTSSGSNLAVIHIAPFNVVFRKEGIDEVVLGGNRLHLTKNEVNAPFTFEVSFTQAIQLYGIHEHCDNLALRNTTNGDSDPYRLKNSDVGGYEIGSPMALYGAVPVLYGLGLNTTAGIFLHNAAEQWIDITSSDYRNSKAYFMVETGTLDLFILLGPTMNATIRQYTALTGKAPLPPLWSLGYHQSRFNYESQEEVLDVVSNFDSHNFQMDAIWLDIDYTDGFKYFTWNPTNFSDPISMQFALANTNRKLVAIIDPHVKVEEGYNVYDGALARDFFVKNPDGSVFQGDCWPGLSSWMDFLNPAARDYYNFMFSYDNFKGSTAILAGIWNDMNEPSVFDNSLEMTLPAGSLHVGNVTHREIHNIYGLLHTMATYQGLINRDRHQFRPFVLTRSHFAGSQRYAAFWTGDSQADWPYLLSGFQECLTANILGLPFCGADVGGFQQNPSNELLERWYQAGAWLPFFRAHSDKSTKRREPYLLPEDSQNVIRSAINTRYRHLPTWYTLFYEHSRTGDPVIRPIFYHYPQEKRAYTVDNEFLVGRNVLVRAVTEPGVDTVEVYFPGGEDEIWFSIVGSDVQSGTGFVNKTVTRDFIPLYYRYGGVVPQKGTLRPNTVEMADDPYTFFYAVNRNSEAFGSIYVDDGTSFEYQDSLNYNYNKIEIHGDDITLVPIDGEGDFEIVINTLIRKDIVKMPRNGTPGVYKETSISKLANGTLLKDIKIRLKERTVLTISDD